MGGGDGEYVTAAGREGDARAGTAAATAGTAAVATMGDPDGGRGGDSLDDLIARQRRAALAVRQSPPVTFVSLTPTGEAAPPGGGAAAADDRARQFTGIVRVLDDGDDDASRDGWGVATCPTGGGGRPPPETAEHPDDGFGHPQDSGAYADGHGRVAGGPPSPGEVADTEQAARDDGVAAMAEAVEGDRCVAGGGNPATATTSMPRLPPSAGQVQEDVRGGSPSPPPRSPLHPTFSHADLAAYARRLSTTVERCGLTGDAAGRAKVAEDELAAGTPMRLAGLVDAAEAVGDAPCLRLLAAVFGGLLRLAYMRLLDVLLAEPVWPRLITALEY